VEFSEANDDWRAIPEWAAYLLNLGYAWPVGIEGQPRRIALLSMPSDSAAAGLIALGAMRRLLEREDANDMGSHYQRLLELARKPSKAVSLRHATERGHFAFDGFDKNGNPWVKKLKSRSGRRLTVSRSSAVEWHIDGEAPVTVLNGRQLPNPRFYADLVNGGGEIRPRNLSESHSEICLAGRGAGEAPTQGWLAEIRFRDCGCEASLSELLTVQSWMPGTVSRVMFYNARTEKFDRQVGKPRIVIADGDTSFLRVLDGRDFEHSDVVGVVHRTMERERLEAVGTRVEGLRQWYDRDDSRVF